EGPLMHVTLYTPSAARRPVPIILLLNFGGGAQRGRGPVSGDPPVAAEILARGWGYATVGYQDIQPDRANAWTEGVVGRTLAPGRGRDGRRHGADFSLAVRRQLSAVRRTVERHAGRRAHADRTQRATAGVHHRRDDRSVVGSQG